MRDLVYYVAASLDGFIASPGGDASVFPVHPETIEHLFSMYPETCPAPMREALGVTAAPRRFDTVLLGRRTHQPAIDAGWSDGAYPHLRQIVVTHHPLDATPGVETMGGDIAASVAALKEEPGADIWLCGGGELASQLVDLIDEVQVKINPFVLGEGVPLFAPGIGHRALEEPLLEPVPGGIMLATSRLRAPEAAS